jgi:hypothetical protein
MSRVIRRRGHSLSRAVAALGLSVWTFACSTYAAPRAGRPLSSASRIRVQSPEPIQIFPPAGSPTAGSLCRVARIDGRLERTAGDTLVFRTVDHVMTVPGTSRSHNCPRFESGVMVVRTDDMRLWEQRVSPGRTTALVLTICAILVGLAAAGASQIDPGFPPSDGTVF